MRESLRILTEAIRSQLAAGRTVDAIAASAEVGRTEQAVADLIEEYHLTEGLRGLTPRGYAIGRAGAKGSKVGTGPGKGRGKGKGPVRQYHTEDYAEHLRALVLEEGMTRMKIAKELKMSTYTLDRMIRELGLSLRGQTQQARMRTIAEAVERGEHLRDIARRLGLSMKEARMLTRRMGLHLPELGIVSKEEWERSRSARREAALAAILTEGLDVEDAANEFGFSLFYLRKLALERGAILPETSQRQRQTDEMIERANRGEPWYQIAADMGVGFATVRRRLKSAGLHEEAERQKPPTMERQWEILGLLLTTTEPVAEIARAYGVTPRFIGTVIARAERCGIPLPQREERS
jgi:methylphosphotriester-DNA--protein-cysteine methyltransferase